LNGSDEEDIVHIQRVLSGEQRMFSFLVEKYEHRLRRFCRSRLPDSEVDDAVQDVFIKAFKGLAGFQLGRSFSPWLFAIALNGIARKKRRFRNEEIKKARFTAENRDVNDSNDGLRELESESLRKAVAALPRSYRDVVDLYYFAELDTDETAKALGLGLEAVKTRLFRARKLLREMLENGNRAGTGGV
jgi:RNA polymerase sigma-70 factor (ECF subfamily)